MEKLILIRETNSVKDALKMLDKTAEKTLLVVDERKKLLGTITDGDIRRYILKGENLERPIQNVYNRNPIRITRNEYTPEASRNLLIKHKIEVLPIVENDGTIVDYLSWEKAFSEDKIPQKPSRKIDIPVVIMAGGKGTRMEPFTRVLPKPLIPIGDSTILEMIIREFCAFGIGRFFLTLNYKAEMIEAYFNSIDKDYEISYEREKDFFGTAGSLKLVEDKIGDTFIVSNCDVIVKADYPEVIQFHKQHGAALTILSAVQHYKIPYGVVQFKEGGEVTSIVEKPEYTFTINTGIYVLDRKCLDFIPEAAYFDMPSLIQKLMDNGKKILLYPVNENDYIDIGQWEEYRKTVSKFSNL